ncbi:hypothetical protein M1P56_11685 [Streptomyces sp. HU2014]|uniref:hypothetical protein n=1 Tax=Streptomyces sp. HU2014 TaxID=2939414 RepID=UPI00200E8511|nr:hypothetical protein [Streptomyces sp. HU2014]UQI44967.1 hypothetical protein M1P56_11685 [Streptomyces sp. HU2014]
MSGLLRLVPDEPEPAHDLAATAGPARPRPRPRWAADPVDQLAEELAEVCAAAVHPDEIAAVLEADGLTGEQITERYGRSDAFELAAELYARVPRSHPEPAPRADPWKAHPGRFALRALVFTLPGFGYSLGAPLMTGARDGYGLPAGTAGLVSSALFAWAWNQGLAHRAYVRLAAGGRPAAGRCLRLGAPLGALLATAAALLAPGPASPVGTTCFAAGQALYLAAATVLLVLGRERLLLLTLAPTAAGGILLLFFQPPSALRVLLLLGTLGGVLGVAAHQILRTREDGAPGAAPSPLASLPYGLFGLGCGVLTTLAALGDVLRRSPGAATAGAAVIALTLSMGAAEWLLYRCRGTALKALARATTTRGMLLGAVRVLALCVAGYLAALTVLAFATALLWKDGPPLTAPRLTALLALGAVLWTGLLLQAFGVAWTPAALCLAAAGAESAALALRISTPATVQLLVCTGAALALLTVATALLGRLTTHR